MITNRLSRQWLFRGARVAILSVSLTGIACGRGESENLSTKAEDDPALFEKAQKETQEWQKSLDEAEKKARAKAASQRR